MVKVYRKDGKFIVYLPNEVIKELGLKGDEEVDFFKMNNPAFMFMKKSDASRLILGSNKPVQSVEHEQSSMVNKVNKGELMQDEIDVLKKIDGLRYNDRTAENVNKMLSQKEKSLIESLSRRKIVSLIKNEKDNVQRYSISKSIYDRYLMRKKSEAHIVKQPGQRMDTSTHEYSNEYAKSLEEKGFAVIPTEAEATSLSLLYEDSIRSGLIVGTRAFNRKFYIAQRSFVNRNSDRIIKAIRGGASKIGDIVRESGIEEDGVRAILYLLSESGEISEKRKDMFELA